MEVKEWLSAVPAIAAVCSAVAAIFSAAAATKSASTARETRNAAVEASRRASLLEIGQVAGQVIVEAGRMQRLANEQDSLTRDQFIFANAFGSSRQKLFEAETQKLREEATAAQNKAAKFSDGATSLREAPSAELDRVLLQQRNLLRSIEALRHGMEEKVRATLVKKENDRSRQVQGFK